MLRDPMISADGNTRVHRVSVDGVQKIRIESRGLARGGTAPAWYHLVDAKTIPEVARHVDLSTLKPMEQ